MTPTADGGDAWCRDRSLVSELLLLMATPSRTALLLDCTSSGRPSPELRRVRQVSWHCGGPTEAASSFQLAGTAASCQAALSNGTLPHLSGDKVEGPESRLEATKRHAEAHAAKSSADIISLHRISECKHQPAEKASPRPDQLQDSRMTDPHGSISKQTRLFI